MIEGNRRKDIIENLKGLYFKSEMFNAIEKIKYDSIKLINNEKYPEKRVDAKKIFSENLLKDIESVELNIDKKGRRSKKYIYSSMFITIAALFGEADTV